MSDELTQEPAQGWAVVFRGSQSLCREYSLVLEARNVEHETHEGEGAWLLSVPFAQLGQAYEELNRYSSERSAPRRSVQATAPFSGGIAGAGVYVAILLITAFCAGRNMFNADWLSLGDLDAGNRSEWWRTVTALTLHLDQEHLLGNVLFGAVAGVGATRLLGPGLAWCSILGAAVLANYAEILIAPATHRAVGASTAVFAALGLLTGMAWRHGFNFRTRLWYRWAPLIAGLCLLTLLGAGAARVDVLGHALGFVFGTLIGWTYVQLAVPKHRGVRLQIVSAAAALALIAAAWLAALSHRA